VLVIGQLPYDFAGRAKRRVVIEGTLSDQPLSVPIPMSRKSAGMAVTVEFELVLEKVTALALYESRCD
jgi:hypothetical protein